MFLPSSARAEWYQWCRVPCPERGPCHATSPAWLKDAPLRRITHEHQVVAKSQGPLLCSELALGFRYLFTTLLWSGLGNSPPQRKVALGAWTQSAYPTWVCGGTTPCLAFSLQADALLKESHWHGRRHQMWWNLWREYFISYLEVGGWFWCQIKYLTVRRAVKAGEQGKRVRLASCHRNILFFFSVQICGHFVLLTWLNFWVEKCKSLQCGLKGFNCFSFHLYVISRLDCFNKPWKLGALTLPAFFNLKAHLRKMRWLLYFKMYQ